jgi:hypothetical protein
MKISPAHMRTGKKYLINLVPVERKKNEKRRKITSGKNGNKKIFRIGSFYIVLK